MASTTPSTEHKATVLLDPWTAAIALEAIKGGSLRASIPAEDGGVSPPTRASTSTATAQAQPQPGTSHTSSVASKFNLPHAEALNVLRMAYYSVAKHMHKCSATPATRPAAQSGPQPEIPVVDAHNDAGNAAGEAREAKRHKTVVGSDSATKSRRALALKRLCSALGVFTHQQHLPAHELSYAVASSRGWRVAMEDTFAAEVPLHDSYGVALFALYDGHGGAEVARYSALHMGRAIREATAARAAFAIEHGLEAAKTSKGVHGESGSRGGGTKNTYAGTPGPPNAGGGSAGADDGGGSPRSHCDALREAFLSLDCQLADEAHAEELMSLANPGALMLPPEAYGRRTAGGPYVGPAAGSTASVALVGQRGITVAAVGDSRCILGSRSGGVVVMSLDHKGNDAAERERVVRAGCWVSASGRVCGELDMSRALGDADMKQAAELPLHLQAVTADPTIMHIRLEPECGPDREAARHPHPHLHSQPQPNPHPAGPHAPDLPERESPLRNAGDNVPNKGARCGSGARHGVESSSTDSRVGVMCGPGSPGQDDSSGAGGGGGGGGWSYKEVGRSDSPGDGRDCGAASGMARSSVGSSDSAGGHAGGEGGVGGAAPGAQRQGGGTVGCYLLLASDGLWNVLDNEAVHEFVMERLEAGLASETICAQLCIEACVSERTAYDNVTVLLVELHGVLPVGDVHVASSTVEAEAVMPPYGAAEAAQVVVEVEVGARDEEPGWSGMAKVAVKAEADTEMAEPEVLDGPSLLACSCNVKVVAEEEEGEEGEEGEVEGDTRTNAEVQRLAGRLWSEVASPSTMAASLQPPFTAARMSVSEELRPSLAAEPGGSAAGGGSCKVSWRELQGGPESDAPAGPLGDAVCRVWLPKPLVGLVGCCPEVAAKLPLGSSGGSGSVMSVVGAERSAMGFIDEQFFDSNPMQDDGPIS